jgi:hypothetical protein
MVTSCNDRAASRRSGCKIAVVVQTKIEETPDHEDGNGRQERSKVFCLSCLAFLLLSFAAAFEAFVALALFCSAVSFLARACPPLRPILAKQLIVGPGPFHGKMLRRTIIDIVAATVPRTIKSSNWHVMGRTNLRNKGIGSYETYSGFCCFGGLGMTMWGA